MGIAEENSSPKEDKKLPKIDIDSNVGINLEGFGLDSMGDSFDGGYI